MIAKDFTICKLKKEWKGRLCCFIILIATGAVIHIVSSRSLDLEDSDTNPRVNIRTKRELDDEDVINRFELERVSPLQDIFYHLPPFEHDWIEAPTPNFTFIYSSTEKPTKDSSEYKLELSKDEEHVFSHSGGKYRSNSAVNWWYSVESYSNFTHYNFTNKASDVGNALEDKTDVGNALEDKTTVTRKLDEDHVVSKVPGLRTGGWTTLDEVVLESPTTPGVTVTLPPKVKEPKPNITTRYILLQSGRIVAINVTSAPTNVLKPLSGSNGNSLPPVYFGSRIRKNNNTASNGVSNINRSTNVTPPSSTSAIINGPARINTQVLPERLQNLRADIITVKPPRPILINALITPLPVRSSTPVERLQDLRTDFTTTKSSRTVLSPVYNVAFTTPPTVRIPVVTETIKPVRNEKITTKTPITTLAPTKPSISLTEPRVTTNPTTEVIKVTKATTKKLFELPPPTKPAFLNKLLSSPSLTTVTVRNLQQFPTRQPSILSNEGGPTTPIPKTTKARPNFSPRDKATTRTPSAFLPTLPPKNIIETIFEVFQPDTSDIPFLVVTFDSLKNPSPTFPTSIELTPTQFSNNRAGRGRTGRLIESKVEYEKVRSTKPSLVHYNFNPYQRPSVTSIQDSATTRVFTTVANRNRGLSNLLITSPVNSGTDRESIHPTVSIPKLKHDFVRIGAPVFSTTPVTSAAPVAKPEITTTKRPRYRGLSFVPQNRPAPSPLPVPPSTAPSLPPTTSRRPRQQQGFHLRNSLGFQTIPPRAFSDRRSIPVSTPLATSPSSEAPLRMNEAMVLHFEPTRKNAAKVDHLQSLSTTATSPAGGVAINRYRATTKRGRVTTPASQVTKLFTSTSSPRQAGFNGGQRPRSPTREVNLGERSFQRQRSQPLVEAKLIESTTSTTAKPFRVYYFEPKRRKPSKNDLPTDSPSGQRNRIATERVQITTSAPTWRSRTNPPLRGPRVLNNIPKKDQPSTVRSATSSSPTHNILTNNQDRSRRGRARPLSAQTTSTVATTSSVLSTRPSSMKPWYIPFIRHQPNVRAAVSSENAQGSTSTSSTARSTRSTSVESFPLPPGDSFEELIFQPLDIRRIN
ncbi:uncharacterized protein NPIL_405491 [Nephila pilipes]|uniref:Uncharacterized protein n=1 Tax=Nephila pilipes TaxID=299642 RepID=A0A8X6PEQ5_NEPPI|nr:uncharacterized protein NPIL_405491 [Nephila pilipes]